MVHLLVHSKLKPLTLVPIQWLFHAEIPISKILKISSTLESLWACHHMNQWSQAHLNQSWNFGSSVPGSAMAVIPRPTSHLATKKSSPGAEVKNWVFGRWTNIATFERNANHHPLFMWWENQCWQTSPQKMARVISSYPSASLLSIMWCSQDWFEMLASASTQSNVSWEDNT